MQIFPFYKFSQGSPKLWSKDTVFPLRNSIFCPVTIYGHLELINIKTLCKLWELGHPYCHHVYFRWSYDEKLKKCRALRIIVMLVKFMFVITTKSAMKTAKNTSKRKQKLVIHLSYNTLEKVVSSKPRFFAIKYVSRF